MNSFKIHFCCVKKWMPQSTVLTWNKIDQRNVCIKLLSRCGRMNYTLKQEKKSKKPVDYLYLLCTKSFTSNTRECARGSKESLHKWIIIITIIIIIHSYKHKYIVMWEKNFDIMVFKRLIKLINHDVVQCLWTTNRAIDRNYIHSGVCVEACGCVCFYSFSILFFYCRYMSEQLACRWSADQFWRHF